MLSDAAITALIVAVPTTIASLGALAVAVIGAIRSRDNGNKVDVATEKVGEVAKRVETVLDTAKEIHQATNGTLSEVKSTRDVLQEKVEGLERALLVLQKSGTLAATTAAQAATDVREAQSVTPPTPETSK